MLHHDAVNFYSILSQYRTPEYAKVNSGWIYLDSTEQLFKHARSRVFNSKQGIVLNIFRLNLFKLIENDFIFRISTRTFF